MSINQSKGTPRVALSQPGSRSTSPTPKYSYLTHNLGTPTSNNYINLNNSENNQELAMTPGGYNINGTLKNNLSGSRSVNTSITKSKIPTSSRNSSRESSPGRRSSKMIQNEKLKWRSRRHFFLFNLKIMEVVRGVVV